MIKDKNYSNEHLIFIKKNKRQTIFIYIMRFAVLVLTLGLWELFAQLEIIDSFISSSPSRIYKTIGLLFIENNLLYHMGITLYETILGFIIAVGLFTTVCYYN